VDPLPFDPARVLLLTGPTGSGKSALALELARHFPLELVCMDAMQLYSELPIGSVAPSAREKALAPHHLFGSFSILHPLSAHDYAEQCAALLGEIQSRGKIPLLVGGTALYLRFLWEDRSGLPATPLDLRRRVARLMLRLGKEGTHRLLARIDPQAAARLHPGDGQRLARFLEVRLLTGRSITEIWQEQVAHQRPAPIALAVLLNREELNSRIARRLREMLDHGWLEEAEALHQAGLAPTVLALRPIGYAALFAHLQGTLPSDRLEASILVQTRQYAKRQMTLLRRFPFLYWFTPKGDLGYTMNELSAFVRARLDSDQCPSIYSFH
jgi:tRNA dimethylallyltransferase